MNYVQGLQPLPVPRPRLRPGPGREAGRPAEQDHAGPVPLFNDKDLALVELNPLAILTDGNLAALDGKINSDDNADLPPPELAAMRDIRQEDPTEVRAPASTTSTT